MYHCHETLGQCADKTVILFCTCLAHLKALSGIAPWQCSQEPCFRETGVAGRANPAEELCPQLVSWPKPDRAGFGFCFFETVSPYVARLGWAQSGPSCHHFPSLPRLQVCTTMPGTLAGFLFYAKTCW